MSIRNLHSIENEQIKESINTEINRLGNNKTYLWKLFFITMTPAILNGMHMYAYVFIGRIPNDVTCVIPSLVDANWTYENIKNISSREVNDKCNILNWNYTLLSTKSYGEALDYINTNPLPNQISCKSVDGYYFYYDSKDILDSFVAQWDLICDRELMRTMVQGSLAFGKFLGAFLFGIVADKFGRKTSVTIGSVLYIIFGPICAFSNDYWLFLISRVALGLAGSAVYHSAYTLFTEMLTPTYRSNMSILFSLSYPIGTILLAIAAYLVQPWRYLQLTISLPALLLIITYWFLHESPRWLVSKGKLRKAYKIVFAKQSLDANELTEIGTAEISSGPVSTQKNSCWSVLMHGIKKIFSELFNLYGKRVSRNRLLICHFAWFSTSLAYYVIALNGDNFLANQYWYVAVTGLTEIPSYFVTIIMFKWMGRKSTSLSLFLLSGLLLLLILAIPSDYNNVAISIAIFSRSCVSAVFAVIILHTAELFPTELRNSAIGLSSTMAHVGTIIAPYIVDFFGKLGWFIPTTICGITLIIAGLLILFLPETKNIELYDMMEQNGENQSTHKSS